MSLFGAGAGDKCSVCGRAYQAAKPRRVEQTAGGLLVQREAEQYQHWFVHEWTCEHERAVTCPDHPLAGGCSQCGCREEYT